MKTAPVNMAVFESQIATRWNIPLQMWADMRISHAVIREAAGDAGVIIFRMSITRRR